MTLDSDADKRSISQMAEFPLMFCVACCIGSHKLPDRPIANGTMTLVRTQGERYGITNYHVIEEFRKQRKECAAVDFYVGNALIDLDACLLDEDKDLDLCTLYLEGVLESTLVAGGKNNTSYIDLDSQTNEQARVGDFVMFGGYPGEWRERPCGHELNFKAFSVAGMEVSDASDRIVRVEVDRNTVVYQAVHGRDVPPHTYGGMSGGPVFKICFGPTGIITFVLVGVIYEFADSFSSFLTRPISHLDSRLCIVY